MVRSPGVAALQQQTAAGSLSEGNSTVASVQPHVPKKLVLILWFDKSMGERFLLGQ